MKESDPIIEQARDAGAAYFSQFETIKSAMEDLRRRGRESGRQTVRLQPKRIKPQPATKKAG